MNLIQILMTPSEVTNKLILNQQKQKNTYTFF